MFGDFLEDAELCSTEICEDTRNSFVFLLAVLFAIAEFSSIFSIARHLLVSFIKRLIILC